MHSDRLYSRAVSHVTPSTIVWSKKQPETSLDSIPSVAWSWFTTEHGSRMSMNMPVACRDFRKLCQWLTELLPPRKASEKKKGRNTSINTRCSGSYFWPLSFKCFRLHTVANNNYKIITTISYGREPVQYAHLHVNTNITAFKVKERIKAKTVLDMLRLMKWFRVELKGCFHIVKTFSPVISYICCLQLCAYYGLS